MRSPAALQIVSDFGHPNDVSIKAPEPETASIRLRTTPSPIGCPFVLSHSKSNLSDTSAASHCSVVSHESLRLSVSSQSECNGDLYLHSNCNPPSLGLPCHCPFRETHTHAESEPGSCLELSTVGEAPGGGGESNDLHHRCQLASVLAKASTSDDSPASAWGEGSQTCHRGRALNPRGGAPRVDLPCNLHRPPGRQVSVQGEVMAALVGESRLWISRDSSVQDMRLAVAASLASLDAISVDFERRTTGEHVVASAVEISGWIFRMLQRILQVLCCNGGSFRGGRRVQPVRFSSMELPSELPRALQRAPPCVPPCVQVPCAHVLSSQVPGMRSHLWHPSLPPSLSSLSSASSASSASPRFGQPLGSAPLAECLSCPSSCAIGGIHVARPQPSPAPYPACVPNDSRFHSSRHGSCVMSLLPGSMGLSGSQLVPLEERSRPQERIRRDERRTRAPPPRGMPPLALQASALPPTLGPQMASLSQIRHIAIT